MKKFVLILGVLSLAGCQLTPASNASTSKLCYRTVYSNYDIASEAKTELYKRGITPDSKECLNMAYQRKRSKDELNRQIDADVQRSLDRAYEQHQAPQTHHIIVH